MALIMKDITKQYKNVLALDKVNARFEDNSIIGLIGFNGSGKTTSFNIITDLIEKFDGSILIEENGVERPITQEDRIMFSYLSAGAEPQNSEKVIDHLNYLGSLHGLTKKETHEQIEEVLKVLEFSEKLNMPIKSLSKGNQQKIKLAGIFINPNMKYLLLDEPFDGLDPIMVEKIKNFILSRKEGLTIIITSHRMDVVDQMCDSFYILKDGVIVDSKNTKTESDETIIIAVNKEMPITNIRKIKGVISATKNNKEIIIVAESLKSFKAINKSLIKEDKYTWSSYREKKLTESVFERYADE